jgi:hypothetical protein
MSGVARGVGTTVFGGFAWYARDSPSAAPKVL